MPRAILCTGARYRGIVFVSFDASFQGLKGDEHLLTCGLPEPPSEHLPRYQETPFPCAAFSICPACLLP